MFKNIQFNKIILALFIIGIVIISGLGIYFLNSLNTLNQAMEAKQTVNMQELQNRTIWILGISGIIFAMVGIATAIFLSKFIIYPINKLIESAEKIADDDKSGKKILKGKKKNDAQNLENVLGIMTTELKDKLSEVSTQKNQIETILLHLTDGIIAFNMKGEIILINPAAKKSLSIRPEDNTF